VLVHDAKTSHARANSPHTSRCRNDDDDLLTDRMLPPQAEEDTNARLERWPRWPRSLRPEMIKVAITFLPVDEDANANMKPLGPLSFTTKMMGY